MYYAPTIEAHMEYVEQKGIQKGIQEGIQKGIQKGRQEGRQEGIQEIIARLEAMGRISKEEAASMVMEATAPVVSQEAPKRARKSSKRTT